MRELQGVVFHIDEDGGRALEKGLVVRLVETGASTDTNDHGEFRLTLPAFFGAGEKVTVSVEKEGWLVRYPFDGKVRIPADPRKDQVEVELLPKGSRKFLDDDERIERLIAETAKETVRQQAALQGEAPREGIDFSRAIREWASRYGLNAEQARAEVDRWVVEVGLRSDDERQLGLAQIYEKNFAKAAEHFGLAARGRKERLAQIEQEEERLGAEKAQAQEELVEDLWLEAGAHYEAYRFKESIATWRETLGYVSQETSASDWAGLQNNLGIALGDQGTRTGGEEEGARLLGEAVEAYRLALIVFTREDLPQDWAATQNNLGNALQNKGIRTGGEEGAKLLGEAVEAYRLALNVYTREALPQDWAGTQNNLGIALAEQGTRTEGEEGARLLGEAVEAYRFALNVFTQENLPQQWARTQNNLGIALGDQGTRTEGEEGARLLGQAIKVFRLALNVFTREDQPQLWARTQNNLGNTLWSQGARTRAEESARLLGQAVEAYHLALNVLTREDQPQLWARIQNNLGNALGDQETRTEGEEGARLLGQTVEAYRLALNIFTRKGLPQLWATTQNNLGIALAEQGIRTEGEEGARLLEQAVKAYRLALNVYTREDLPQRWATIQNNLGNALRNQGTRTEGEKGARLLGQAVKVYRLALNVRTRENLPQGWATTQNNLGNALANQGTRTGSKKGVGLLVQAVEAYRLALSVRTQEHLTYGWVQTRDNLGDALQALGHFDEAAAAFRDVLEEMPNYQDGVHKLSNLYHENLHDHEAAHDLLSDWLARHPDDVGVLINFPELLFTTQRYEDCQEASFDLADRLTQANVLPETAAVLRAFTAASLLAQDDIPAATPHLRAVRDLVREQPEGFTIIWTFSGTFHFVRHTPDLPNREILDALFQALDAPDRVAIVKRLEAIVRVLDPKFEGEPPG